MKNTEMNCPLCDTQGATSEATDFGNRQRITCRAGCCGEFVITHHAARRLREGGPNREVLAEMVRQANSRKHLLDISVGGDGLIVANDVARLGLDF